MTGKGVSLLALTLMLIVLVVGARRRKISTSYKNKNIPESAEWPETPREIVCPETISTFTDLGESFATVPFAVRAFGAKIDKTSISCTHESESPFDIGETQVTCYLPYGNAICSFFVIVSDKEAPTITCPENVDTSALLFEGGLDVEIPATSATDNSGDVTVECSHSGTTFLQEGTTVVRCTAKDGADNEACCEFEVHVVNRFLDALFCGVIIEGDLSFGVDCGLDGCLPLTPGEYSLCNDTMLSFLEENQTCAREEDICNPGNKLLCGPLGAAEFFFSGYFCQNEGVCVMDDCLRYSLDDCDESTFQIECLCPPGYNGTFCENQI